MKRKEEQLRYAEARLGLGGLRVAFGIEAAMISVVTLCVSALGGGQFLALKLVHRNLVMYIILTFAATRVRTTSNRIIVMHNCV